MASRAVSTTPMAAALVAMSRVRDGMWIRGAPTHVLAEFLTELEKDGWVLTTIEKIAEVDVTKGAS